MIRTVIHDRRRLMRDGLRLLLDAQDDIDVTASTGSERELLAACDPTPDVVVVQANGPATDTAITELRRRHPDLRVIAVSGGDVDRDTPRLVEAGADAVVASHQGVACLVDAMRAAQFRPPSEVPTVRSQTTSNAAGLSARERQVLTLVAIGWTTKQIAAELGISVKTIENHKHRIFIKLGVHNQAHAVSIALRSGLLDLSRGPHRRASGD